MKRVLVYGMTQNRGGMESCVMNYFSHFDRSRLMFDFVVDCPDVAYRDEIEKMGGKIYFIPSRRDGLLSHMKALRRVVKQNGYKTVYFNILSASAVFSVASVYGLKGVCAVVHSHNNSVGNLSRHEKLRPLLNFVTDKRLACSEEAAVFMFGDEHRQDTLIVNNAIDLEAFAFSPALREDVRREFSLGDAFVVGHVGRLCAQKNTLFLLDIFKEVLKKQPDALLLLVGDGEDRQKVEQKIKDLNMEQNVRMTGMRSDVSRLFTGMDVFLLPSLFEGLPVTLIESQAAGLPSFTSVEAVPDAAKVTDDFFFLSLSLPPKEWAEKLLAYKGLERRDNVDHLRGSDYDIHTQAKQMEEYFLGL